MTKFLIRLHTMYGLATGKTGKVAIAPSADIVDLITWLVEETDYEPTDLVFPVDGEGWSIPGKNVSLKEDVTIHGSYTMKSYHILEVTDDTLAVHIKLKYGFAEMADQ
jgi:hypothetical protein